MIETPANIRAPFRLRDAELSHEERFRQNLELKKDTDEIIQTIYNFVRDFPEIFKNEELKEVLIKKLFSLLELADLTPPQKIQIFILLEHYFDVTDERVSIKEFIHKMEDLETLVNSIDIIAFRKRALVAVHRFRADWPPIFMQLLFSTPQTALKDYLLKELQKQPNQDTLEQKLTELRDSPTKEPETFIWYFQKVMNGEEIPLSDRENQYKFFESFLILISKLETRVENRDLVKKMYSLLTAGRYAQVRSILQGSDIEFVKEMLLLASKCQVLTDHDIKILHSLAEVVHSSLSAKKKGPSFDQDVIWATEDGYRRTRDRVQEISQVEMIENAKEIEAARAHGDLRENAEYKCAQERRARLQDELKMLSDSLNKARIITKEDVDMDQVGIGSVVQVAGPNSQKLQYTLLGPWEANPDENVLSINSKLAQSIVGKKVGETFEFQGSDHTIERISSFLG